MGVCEERRFGPACHRPASRLVAPCSWTDPCKVLLEVNQRRKQSWNPRGGKLWAQTRDRVLAVLSHTVASVRTLRSSQSAQGRWEVPGFQSKPGTPLGRAKAKLVQEVVPGGGR